MGGAQEYVVPCPRDTSSRRFWLNKLGWTQTALFGMRREEAGRLLQPAWPQICGWESGLHTLQTTTHSSSAPAGCPVTRWSPRPALGIALRGGTPRPMSYHGPYTQQGRMATEARVLLRQRALPCHSSIPRNLAGLGYRYARFTDKKPATQRRKDTCQMPG